MVLSAVIDLWLKQLPPVFKLRAFQPESHPFLVALPDLSPETATPVSLVFEVNVSLMANKWQTYS